jgi:type IV secretion system protein VirB11
VAAVPRRLIAEAIDLIVFISGRGPARRVQTLLAVEGLDAAGDYMTAPFGTALFQSLEEK